MEISNTILQAIEILVNAAIENAPFDKTIIAQIERISDIKKREYKCNYMGAIITANAINSDVTYEVGDYVYILIPKTTNGTNKIILGKQN